MPGAALCRVARRRHLRVAPCDARPEPLPHTNQRLPCRRTGEHNLTWCTPTVTQWGYNSADLITWMKYPSNNTSGAGEQVNYTYLNQLLLDTVIGTSTYVYNTDYDAAGRVELRQLKSSGTIWVDYSYFGWDVTHGIGRLQQILSGITGRSGQPAGPALHL